MMKITPTAIRDNKIDIVINNELSRINNSVSVGGYPEILKKQAYSRLQIKDEYTMVLAGPISELR